MVCIEQVVIECVKTNYMIFSSKPICNSINIVFDKQRVNTAKLLGVIIEDRLSWLCHVLHVCKKLNKSLAVINKVKNILNDDTMKYLYNALILPYLLYCCEVWGNASKYLIDRVVVLQKRAIRIISKSEYKAHTLPLFIKYNLLKFVDIVKFKILLLMYKAKEGSLPDNLQMFFKIKTSDTISTRQDGKFYVAYARTKIKANCISICGVKLWNNLNVDISNIKPFKKFKLNLKKHIINSY